MPKNENLASAHVLLSELRQVELRREEPPWEALGEHREQQAFDAAQLEANKQFPKGHPKWKTAFARAWNEACRHTLEEAEARSLGQFEEQVRTEAKEHFDNIADAAIETKRVELLRTARKDGRETLNAPQLADLAKDTTNERARATESSNREIERRLEAEQEKRARAQREREVEKEAREQTLLEVEQSIAGTPPPGGIDSLAKKARAHARDMDLTGLAFSGGGIRSATFCLGVLQGLADCGLVKRIDYLSTVSGGGFIGSWLTAWVKREGRIANVEKQLKGSRVDQAKGRLPLAPEIATRKEPVEAEPEPIFHLRSYSNYLAPRLGLDSADSWVLVAIYVRNFLLNHLVLLPALLAVLLLPRLAMLFYDWRGEPSLIGTYRFLGGLTVVALASAASLIVWAVLQLRRAAALAVGGTQSQVRQTNLCVLKFGIVPLLVAASFLACWFAWDDFSLTQTNGFVKKVHLEWLDQGINRFIDKEHPYWRTGLLFGLPSAILFTIIHIVFAILVYGRKSYLVLYALIIILLLGVSFHSLFNDWSALSDDFPGVSYWRTALSFGIPAVMSLALLLRLFPIKANKSEGHPGGSPSAVNREPSPYWWIASGFVSGLLGGTLLGLLQHAASDRMHTAGEPSLAQMTGFVAAMVTAGPPVVLLVIVFGAIIQIGVMGRYLDEAEREWWGSLCGWILRWAVLWAAFCALALFGVPFLVLAGPVVQKTLGAGWLATAIGGVLAARSPSTGSGTTNRPMDLLAKVAPFVFVLGLIVALSWLLSVCVDKPPSAAFAARFVARKHTPEEVPTQVKHVAVEAQPAVSTRTREFVDQPDHVQIRLWRYWAGLFNTRKNVDDQAPLGAFDAGKVAWPGGLDGWPALVASWVPPTYPDLWPQERLDLLVKLLCWLVVLTVLALLASARVGVNTFSLHNTYGNRLVRCYLGASRKKERLATRDEVDSVAPNIGPPPRLPNPVTGFDPKDDLPLHALVIGRPKAQAQIDVLPANERPYRGPYLLVNTALNLVQGEELAWQERKAEAFLMSPLFCGSKSTDYQPTYDKDAGAYAGGLSLGTAVTVSGAAASPNMGYHSSPAVTALLTMFNVRLGGWFGNPAAKSPPAVIAWLSKLLTKFNVRLGKWFGKFGADQWTSGEPRMSLVLLFKELFGRTDARSWYVYLSDGGHFENLGVYELVRRHCRFIIAVDSGADSAYDFDDLGGLIRKCRSDLGVPIEIDVSAIKPQGPDGLSRAHCAVGKIRYDCIDPEAVPGVLVYLKASLGGNEPADVRNYAVLHPSFPHESTANQFFTESQFESYRALGHHIAREVFMEAMRNVEETDLLTDAAHRRVVRPLFANLRRRWSPPPPQFEPSSLESLKGCLQLDGDLRKETALEAFSLDLYPELEKFSGAPATPAAAPGHGANLYAVNQMLQVMELAWYGGQFEGNHAHPSNREWMNVFRRWASAPAFRTVWPGLRGGFNQDFVRFCENELKLDRGVPRAYQRDANLIFADRAWPALRDEFRAEWPHEPPLEALVTQSLARFMGMPLALGPMVWLIASVPSTDPTPHTWPDPAPVGGSTPHRYPAGIALVRAAPDSAQDYELLLWLRGAYRNLGIGRGVLSDGLLAHILTRLEAITLRGFLRVRWPREQRLANTDRLQQELWQAFFFDFGFHKVYSDPPSRDLILRKYV